jgi:hypothetical protein
MSPAPAAEESGLLKRAVEKNCAFGFAAVFRENIYGWIDGWMNGSIDRYTSFIIK